MQIKQLLFILSMSISCIQLKAPIGHAEVPGEPRPIEAPKPKPEPSKLPQREPAARERVSPTLQELANIGTEINRTSPDLSKISDLIQSYPIDVAKQLSKLTPEQLGRTLLSIDPKVLDSISKSESIDLLAAIDNAIDAGLPTLSALDAHKVFTTLSDNIKNSSLPESEKIHLQNRLIEKIVPHVADFNASQMRDILNRATIVLSGTVNLANLAFLGDLLIAIKNSGPVMTVDDLLQLQQAVNMAVERFARDRAISDQLIDIDAILSSLPDVAEYRRLRSMKKQQLIQEARALDDLAAAKQNIDRILRETADGAEALESALEAQNADQVAALISFVDATKKFIEDKALLAVPGPQEAQKNNSYINRFLQAIKRIGKLISNAPMLIRSQIEKLTSWGDKITKSTKVK